MTGSDGRSILPAAPCHVVDLSRLFCNRESARASVWRYEYLMAACEAITCKIPQSHIKLVVKPRSGFAVFFLRKLIDFCRIGRISAFAQA